MADPTPTPTPSPTPAPAPSLDPNALKAIVGEAVKGLLPEVVAALRPPPAKEEVLTLAQLKGDLEKMRLELQRRDEALAVERARAAVMQEVSTVPWFDPSEAVERIAPRVKHDEQGYHVVEQETVAGVVVPVRRTIGEAAAALAKQRPYLVRADVRSGAGATGGSNGSGRAASGSGDGQEYRGLTYEQAIARSQQNKASFLRYIREHADEWAEKKRTAAEAAAQVKR